MKSLCCGKTDIEEVEENNGGKRKELHDFCSLFRLNHRSYSRNGSRIVVISRPDKWCWEFTEIGPDGYDDTGDSKAVKKQEKRREVQRERMSNEAKREHAEEMRYQVFHNFRAHGYFSPQDMLDAEPRYMEFCRGHAVPEVTSLESELILGESGSYYGTGLYYDSDSDFYDDDSDSDYEFYRGGIHGRMARNRPVVVVMNNDIIGGLITSIMEDMDAPFDY